MYYTVGLDATSAFSADLDGDNDLAVANVESGSVSVFLNRSDIPTAGVTAVIKYEEPLSDIPEAYAISQNYRNPCNPGTVLYYDLPV